MQWMWRWFVYIFLRPILANKVVVEDQRGRECWGEKKGMGWEQEEKNNEDKRVETEFFLKSEVCSIVISHEVLQIISLLTDAYAFG